MASRDDAVLAVQQHAQNYQPILSWDIGYLGDGSGSGDSVSTSSPYHVKVRYTLTSSSYAEIYCVAANVPRVDGLAVKVGYTAYAPTLLQVIEPADVRISSINTGDPDVTTIPGGTIGYTLLAPHAASHMYLSTDPVMVNWRQITPLGVFPAGGMLVRVWPGMIPRPGLVGVDVPSQTVDLTSHLPGSGARYALISFDATGTVVVTDGTINPSGFTALSMLDIPATPAGNWRSAAVVLYVGQTALVETRAENDFRDLRFPEEQGALSITASDLGQAILASQIFGG